MSARIPIAGPWITEKEIRYVTEAVANGWYENSATYQGEFETAFAAFTGRRYGLALPSCTSGLHPLEFLLKPLQEQIARTFRER